MNAQYALDEPLSDPSDDLLGMAIYAQRLAEFIRDITPPFTIGVYGEWGSGKTTFVQFTKHYLVHSKTSTPEQDVKFISFSAWPHTTSDELWRALIMTMAKELYDVSDEGQNKYQIQPEQKPQSIRESLISFLTSPAISSPNQVELSEFEKILSELESTNVGSIRKDQSYHLQINQEEAILAAINAVLTSLEQYHPLLELSGSL
ncbi:KAP family NTPase [Chloroflexi bacterium TSY]|nr:KAP family NTPase [Chloroflexi bacterium TSY]